MKLFSVICDSVSTNVLNFLFDTDLVFMPWSFNSEEVRKKIIVENYQLSSIFLFIIIIIFIILNIYYLDGLAVSTILSSLDSKYLDQLKLYLHPALQNSGSSKFVRCWHAKTDGWAASTFHSNCDGKGPTVTAIVRVGSYIFGGYTDKPWSSPSKY